MEYMKGRKNHGLCNTARKPEEIREKVCKEGRNQITAIDVCVVLYGFCSTFSIFY